MSKIRKLLLLLCLSMSYALNTYATNLLKIVSKESEEQQPEEPGVLIMKTELPKEEGETLTLYFYHKVYSEFLIYKDGDENSSGLIGGKIKDGVSVTTFVGRKIMYYGEGQNKYVKLEIYNAGKILSNGELKEQFQMTISEHDHSMVSASAATCNAVGKPARCSECGYYFLDDNGTNESQCSSSFYYPALGHEFTQEWTIDGDGKYRVCAREGCSHRQYSYDVTDAVPAFSIELADGETLTYPQSKAPKFTYDRNLCTVSVDGSSTACELTAEQIKKVTSSWNHNNTAHQCDDKSWVDGCSYDGCTEGLSRRWVYINSQEVETTTTTGDIIIDNLDLTYASGYQCDATLTANTATYSRTMTNRWGTLCLPMQITYNGEAKEKYYKLSAVTATEIQLEEITEDIPAGTPVLVRRSADANGITLTVNNVPVTTAPIDGSTVDGMTLVGTFTPTEALPESSYVIGNNKFWLVKDLNATEGNPKVRAGAFRAYISSTEAQTSQPSSLRIESGEATAIAERLNALTDEKAEYYDLNGRRIDGLRKGVNIVRRNGTTTKVTIK